MGDEVPSRREPSSRMHITLIMHKTVRDDM